MDAQMSSPGWARASTGLLLKTIGLNVTSTKIDPYMNIDAGTMAPTESGTLLSSYQEGTY